MALIAVSPAAGMVRAHIGTAKGDLCGRAWLLTREG